MQYASPWNTATTPTFIDIKQKTTKNAEPPFLKTTEINFSENLLEKLCKAGNQQVAGFVTVCVVVIFKIIKVDERNRFLKRKFPARTVSSEFFIFKNDKILKGAAVLEF